jgi:hypothetical protein
LFNILLRKSKPSTEIFFKSKSRKIFRFLFKILENIYLAESPEKGNFPVRQIYITIPRDHISQAIPNLEFITSGAM